MLSTHHRQLNRAKSAGFSLMEMLMVISIMGILVALTAANFRSGAGSSIAADVASSVFSQARAQAIMHRTYAIVIVDSDTSNSSSTTLYRRMMVVYLSSSVTAPAPMWTPAGPWVTLPGNNYIDAGYSNPFGSLSLTINGSAHSYAYYGFDASGQACVLPSSVSVMTTSGALTETMPGSVINWAGSPVGQLVVSPGRISGTTFVERDSHSRYGFYVFTAGRVAFFQDIADDLATPPAHALQ